MQHCKKKKKSECCKTAIQTERKVILPETIESCPMWIYRIKKDVFEGYWCILLKLVIFCQLDTGQGVKIQKDTYDLLHLYFTLEKNVVINFNHCLKE